MGIPKSEMTGRDNGRTARIAEAEESTPGALRKHALQAAIAANGGATDGKTVRERSVRAGGECYRVACIADAIAEGPQRTIQMARGGSAVPLPMPGQASVVLEVYADHVLKKQA